MRKLLAIIGLVGVAAIGIAVQPAAAITYGQVDGTRHPNVGSLLVRNGHGKYLQTCTVSLIASDVVLTAAHCVQGADPESFWVTFDPQLSPDITVIHGTAHYDHRAYTQGTANPHDIAVVVLDRSVDLPTVDLPPIGLLDRLRAAHELHGHAATAVGYGARRVTQQGGFTGILNNQKRRYVVQHVLSLQDQWLLLSMNPATGNGGTCYGDSGGPHFLGGVQSNLEVALTVFGDAVCKATDKDFRLDTPAAQNFIGRFVDL
jgi:secreted trypsin-like serine protease